MLQNIANLIPKIPRKLSVPFRIFLGILAYLEKTTLDGMLTSANDLMILPLGIIGIIVLICTFVGMIAWPVKP